MPAPALSPAQVRFAHLTQREIALLDLREESAFAVDHPLFAVSLPLSVLELEVLDRIPNKAAQIVVYGEDDKAVATAIIRLEGLGYASVCALAGGLEGWRAAGLELFQDVNSASKAFGELVETRRHTPSIPAREAKALIDGGADIAILDARTFEEFNTMSIPKGVSVPGAELVLRAREIAPDPATTVIVNCAGRTRSIIGAQSLINAGLPNPVFALRNGAIGWRLAGLSLDQGQVRRFGEVEAASQARAAADAREVAYRAGAREIDLQALGDLAAETGRTLYRLDVRPPEEYAAGHIPGFQNAPGGQLVQETDVWAAVRGARIVLADDRGARAHMSASWLAQMGWETYVLTGGFEGALETGAFRPTRPPLPPVEAVDADALDAGLRSGAVTLLDLAPSTTYRKGHVPGAWFAMRGRFPEALARLGPASQLALTSPDGALAAFAAPELAALTGHAPLVLQGGTAAWVGSGRTLEPGMDRLAVPDDDVYKRPYVGQDVSPAAMQGYLDWEAELVAQLARDGSHGFYVI